MQGYECLGACLSFQLLYDNVIVFPEEICFLGGGFKVWYEKGNKIGLLSTSAYKANFNFLQRYNIKYDIKSATSEDEARCILKEMLKKKKKIILKVSANKLTYDSVYSKADTASHFINALDRDGNSIYIFDGYVPKIRPKVFEGWVKENDIIKAWQGRQFKYIVLENDNVRIENKYDEVKTAVTDGIRAYVSSGVNENEIYGQNAIMQIWMDFVNLENVNDIAKYALNINYQMRVFGFVSLKQMLICLLNRWNVKYSLTEEYSAIVDKWENVCMALIKCSYSKRVSDSRKIAEQVLLIIAEEKQCLLEILNVLDISG